MDELKHRAGEKLGALHEAAKTAADSSKTRVQDVFTQTLEAIEKIRTTFRALWHNEFIAEGRERVAAWSRDAIQRIRDGVPPLSPIVIYEELLALFHDRVWRRSMVIFSCGLAVGGATGVLVGMRAAARQPGGPHARALHTHTDCSVILVEDARAASAGAGEVLVRVQAFSVCPVDRCTLRGRGRALRSLLGATLVTQGRGFAGVVLDVGCGVEDLEMGDEVWGCVSEWSGGAASELLTVRSSRVSKRPRSVSADAAASLPWAGADALDALAVLGYSPETCKGKRVAVVGAGGGQGCALVQLLARWGAAVAALAPRHAALALQDLGATEYVDMETGASAFSCLEVHAKRTGPWDAIITCLGAPAPSDGSPDFTSLLKARAPRGSVVDLRPRALLSDRLPAPLALGFGVSFYTYRLLRWCAGGGAHTDWLEARARLRGGLAALAALVDSGSLVPVLDKVYLPQEYEEALAHACGEDALGTTVVRFP